MPTIGQAEACEYLLKHGFEIILKNGVIKVLRNGGFYMEIK